jgi:hypothetical protein
MSSFYFSLPPVEYLEDIRAGPFRVKLLQKKGRKK